MTSVLASVREREPFAGDGGRTGANFERGVLPDGSRVILKSVSRDDWIPRAMGATDVLYKMWTSGIFERVPDSIDHLTLSVEPEGDAYVIVMRDASDELLGDERVLTRAENIRLLSALDDLHCEFRDTNIEGLVSLFNHYSWITPAWIAEHGLDDRAPVWRLIPRGWELFADVAPDDIVRPMQTLIKDPRPLAHRLQTRPQTLLHGDARLHNMGLTDERLVLFDWEVAGYGPPAVDFAWYLIISASRIDASREQVIDDYRAVAGELFDAEALELALIGALVRLGWNKALDIVENPDPGVREAERADLDWWIARVRRALEIWSPI